jgi:hypothetical protein
MSNFLIDEDTDLLAAEFVLGTLDVEERANAQSLLRTDHGFIAMVRIWERRFGELHLMVEPVEPEPKIWQRIKTKLAEIAPSEPVPEGKPPPELTPSPQPAAAASLPTNADLAERALAEPADAVADGELSAPPVAPANGTAAKPTETLPAAETEKPAETPTAPELVGPPPVVAPTATAMASSAAEIPPSAEIPPPPEPQPSELAARSEEEPTPKVAIPAEPSLPPPALKLPDPRSDQPEPQRAAGHPEINIDVIRSRGRWRVLGVCMTLLVMGLVALLAAWRFVPNRLPAGLRPAQLMTSLGIQASPNTAAPAPPAVRRAAPESQFDE